MTTYLISRICHFLQCFEIEIKDGDQKHGYCEDAWEISAEDIGWDSLFAFNG